MSIIHRLNGKLDGCWCPFLSEFHVPDPQAQSGSSGPSVVFVVESPHTCEVCLGFPLAGKSGKAIASKLIEEGLLCPSYTGQPLGEIVQKRCLDWLHVVNVCELPLQADTYHQLFAAGKICPAAGLPSLKGWGELMLASKTILAYGAKSSDRWPKDPLVQEIIEDFRDRLRGTVSDSSLVVALGNVANVACKKAAKREKERTASGNDTWKQMLPNRRVPHPARNGWDGEEVTAVVQEILKRVREHRNGPLD